MKVAVIGTSAVILLIIIVLGITISRSLTPSNEVMLLTDYYGVEDSEVMVVLQDRIYEKKGRIIDGIIYMDYNTIIQEFNPRFYWDNNENMLTYTTPNEILQVEAGSSGYSITKSVIKTKASEKYPIVKIFADEVFVALDFVKKYSNMEVKVYGKPNRVVINYRWGDYLFTETTKSTQLRKEPSIKSPILLQMAVDNNLMFVNTEEAPKKGFIKVMTEDGIIGYVKEKHIKKSYYKTLKSTYNEPEYTAQTRPYKINLVFHQVFNDTANNSLASLIKSTKGVTVVSPTWFSVKDANGNISSLASHSYVEKAKELELEVWALVDDFNTEINMYDVLSYTSRRENLSNALVDKALEYKLNGINIDFEKITADTGQHYVQFLRELSVKCRNNGIVLSVDNYVPAPYNGFYNITEQGKILDYLIIMAYDEHYSGSPVAGPVSSIGFVKDAITNTLAKVPKEKVIMAIPFYTRLWKEKDGVLSSESFGMTMSKNILEQNNVEAEWDQTSACYYGEYQKDGATFKMWQEEEKSIEEKMKEIYNANVAGVAAWKLGLEKESVWNIIIKYIN